MILLKCSIWAVLACFSSLAPCQRKEESCGPSRYHLAHYPGIVRQLFADPRRGGFRAGRDGVGGVEDFCDLQELPSIENVREAGRPLHRAVLARPGTGRGDLSRAAAHERRAAAGRGAGGRVGHSAVRRIRSEPVAVGLQPRGGIGGGRNRADRGAGRRVRLSQRRGRPRGLPQSIRAAAVHHRERLLREGQRERRCEPAASARSAGQRLDGRGSPRHGHGLGDLPELPHPARRGQQSHVRGSRPRRQRRGGGRREVRVQQLRGLSGPCGQ
jgi:hypothetical protein